MAALVAMLVLFPISLHAQADSVAQDTTARDTTARDTTARDTAAALLPVLPPELPPSPRPAGARYVFDADSLLFSNIYTLSDLLAHVPGVYVARGGFFGQAEYVLYGGRGAHGLEVYWDGVPYVPGGRDSVFLDPARIALAPLQRIEVLPSPGVLRVYLISRREQSTHASSAVGVVTGDRDIARYRGLFARRWRSGVGLSLIADWHDINGAPGSSSSAFSDVEVWANIEYIPSPRFGASYQVLTSKWDRAGEPGLVEPWQQERRDGLLRVFYAPSGAATGPRLQVAMARVSLGGDTAVPNRSVTQFVVDGVYAWPRAHASLAARWGDRGRPLEVEASAAWHGLGILTLAADARLTRYTDAREGRRASLSAGLLLPLGFSLRGEAVQADELQAPSLTADTVQETFDVAWAARWERRWITLEFGGGRRDDYAPGSSPAGLAAITGFRTSPRTDYVRVSGSVRPAPWISIAGWFFDPLDGGGDFEPPRHARVTATFFSRFPRVFRSSEFALRAEVALESWGSWVGGLSGATLNGLTGASFVETNFEMRIGDVTAFWAMRNTNGMRAGYVPGSSYPRALQYFGVQWRFRN